MENFSSELKQLHNQLKSTEKPKKISQRISKIMDLFTFEEGVRKGIYSDDKGTAYLILNGVLSNTYNVYIDRRRITKAGAVVSFEGLLKSYSPDEIQIRYDLKEPKMIGRLKGKLNL